MPTLKHNPWPESLKDADAMQLIARRQFGGIPDYRPFGQDDESDDELVRPWVGVQW